MNKIQASQATANRLIEEGKSHWVTRRHETVEAKGKGLLETYWITPRPEATKSETSGGKPVEMNTQLIQKQGRLIDWCKQLLLEHLKRVVARRHVLGLKDTLGSEQLVYEPPREKTSLDEVEKFIRLPEFNSKIAHLDTNTISQDVVIDKTVEDQLHQFVTTIASTYQDNPFHNFEHAAHVTMAYVFWLLFPVIFGRLHVFLLVQNTLFSSPVWTSS